MLKVVTFENGKFGLVNTWTGRLLENNGKPLTYKTKKKAHKSGEKRTKKLNKSIKKLRVYGLIRKDL